ncbi:MAG: hypothetical protein ACK2T0_13995 [Anaerolineales bacterium]
MRFRRRAPLALRDVTAVAAAIFVVAAILGFLVAADFRLSSLGGQGGEFLSLWLGARAFLLASSSPYSADIAAAAQRLAYGGAALPGQNPLSVTLPFFLYPAFFPFVFVSSAVAARGIWLFLMQAALAATMMMSFSLADWRPPRTVIVLVAAGGVFAFYSVAAMLAGTPVILLALLYVGILRALQTDNDELAGLLLGLSFFKWQVGLLLVVLVLWRVFHEKRWGVLAGLIMTVVILAIASFLLYPTWLLPFLISTVGDIRSDYGLAAGQALNSLLPGSSLLASRALAAVLSSLLIYEWWSSRRAGFRRFMWLCFLALAATPLLGFRTELASLVALVPSMVLITSAAANRSRSGAWVAVLLAIAVFGVPWLLLARIHQLGNDVAAGLLFLFAPLATILGLYWTRWWFTRSPRTWLDEVRAAGG